MSVDAVTSAALTRAAIGASAWLAPITAGKAFGIDASQDVSAALYLRLGGSRDFALAAGPLLTSGANRRKMLGVAAACDLGDILAVVLARKEGKISDLGAGLFIGASLACLALGAKAFLEAPAES
jgi:hypothetical protein